MSKKSIILDIKRININTVSIKLNYDMCEDTAYIGEDKIYINYYIYRNMVFI